MIPILKYPRTPHLAGSRLQPGDEDLDTVARHLLADLPIVVEEKFDGANCGISFTDSGDMLLQSRGHILTGGPREKQFDLFKRWANHHSAILHSLLGHRYILYGEWLFARHTLYYDLLPHYFLEFDMFDREHNEFLSTPRRHAILSGSPVVSAPILAAGMLTEFESLIGPSRASTQETMEGLYIKHEAEGRVLGRYKFVRPGFTQRVEASGEHWMDRPIEPNQLRAGVDLFR